MEGLHIPRPSKKPLNQQYKLGIQQQVRNLPHKSRAIKVGPQRIRELLGGGPSLLLSRAQTGSTTKLLDKSQSICLAYDPKRSQQINLAQTGENIEVPTGMGVEGFSGFHLTSRQVCKPGRTPDFLGLPLASKFWRHD